MTTRAEIIYREAHMLSNEPSEEDRQLLRAALYYIQVALGDKPMPASDSDRAANAYAARTMELAE